MNYVENHSGKGLPTPVTEALLDHVSKLVNPAGGEHSVTLGDKHYSGQLIVGARDVTFRVKSVSDAAKAPKKEADTAPKKEAAPKKAAAKAPAKKAAAKKSK